MATFVHHSSKFVMQVCLPSLYLISLMQFELSIGKKVATLSLRSLLKLGSVLSRRTSVVAYVDLSLLATLGYTGIIIRKKI